MPACMHEHQSLPASQAALQIRKRVGFGFFFLMSALYLIIYLFIYLFLVALGLFAAQAFSSFNVQVSYCGGFLCCRARAQ